MPFWGFSTIYELGIGQAAGHSREHRSSAGSPADLVIRETDLKRLNKWIMSSQ